MHNLKAELYKLCTEYVKIRIDTAEQAILSAQQSAGEETKSSAGDKYETGREMMQQETNRNMTQLAEANKLLIALNQININNPKFDRVQPGSLIITNNGDFYMAISAGALHYDGKTYFAISMASPIGLLLKGKKSGESISMNNRTYLIKNIM
jgi:transcription elongation GreA/GreB family factor